MVSNRVAEQDEIAVPECLPVVPAEVPAPAPTGEEETSEDEDLAASELPVATQNHKSWKSFRSRRSGRNNGGD